MKKEQREIVLVRDNYECIDCGEDDKSKLYIHHKKPINSNMSLEQRKSLESLDNLETVCSKCHKKRHKQAKANYGHSTFVVTKDVYKALRIKLLAQGRTVSEWLREKMLEEVIGDEKEKPNQS